MGQPAAFRRGDILLRGREQSRGRGGAAE
ncbi:hypothetical protein LUU34_01654700 [Aix galericulata]|nr:hypothetical protein LUU34_01654700 [Aix galericulata]